MSDLDKVKQLRKSTGAGFKDCNAALDESKGDIDKAIEILRVKGISKASKKMSRVAKEGVIALTLTLNGKLIEWVYKENISQCLKSKRVASREVGGERVIFACRSVKALLQEDKQAKYGIRLLKILD